jgi:hypothetical protein
MKAAQMTAMEHGTGDVWRVGCDLERELNAANDMFRKLNIHALNLTDRIKRLEDAGDYLCAAAAFLGWHDKIEAWNQAKEAK